MVEPHTPLFFAVVAVSVAFLFAWAAAMISAANYGEEIWKRAGYDRGLWIASMNFTGGLVGIVYLVLVRPKLVRAERASRG